MAYDTEIRIKTKIDTSQMQNLQIQMEKTANKVVTLTAKLDELKNKKIPTDAYTELEEKIKNAEFVLRSFIDAQKKLSEMKVGIEGDKEILDTYLLVKKLKEELNKSVESKDQDAYLGIEDRLNRAKETLQGMMSSNPRPLGDIAYYYSIQSEIDNAQIKVENIRAEMQKLVENGKAFTPVEDKVGINNAADALSLAQAELRSLIKKQDELNDSQNKTKSNLYSISDRFKKIGDAAKRLFAGITKGAKKSNSTMGTFASRIKGIALSLLVFNWITKGFNTMVTGMKEGFKNLAKHSESYRQALSDLMGANIQMKNSFAAAFTPIVQLIIPHLITLVNYITLASNKIAQFIAVMSGQKTWIKATEVQGDYAGSLNGTAAAAKKAAGALAKFDDLDVLNKSDKSQSGGSGSKPEGGFEEVPLPDNGITNLAKRLKELIGAEDWYGVGALLGEKLNDALGSIDWASIKQKAFELGKNLAVFLNGGIETTNWHLVGSTIAEGLNTAIEFVYGFVTTFGWAGLGSAIAGSINGFFDTFDPVKAGITLSDCIIGLLTTSIAAITETEWHEIGKDVAEFLNAIKWKEILEGTGELIVSTIIAAMDFVKGFDKEADNITKSIVNGFIAAGIAGKIGQALKLTLGETIAVALFGWVAKQSLDGVTEPIKNAESLLDAMPKKEDYDNIRMYNEALAEWKGEMEGLSATQFDLPFLEYDENGTAEWWVNLKQSCVEAVAAFNEWAGNFKDELPGKINSAMDGARGAFVTKWAEICTWWEQTALVGWWNNYISPWFTAQKWQELGQGILEGISTKWGEFCLWWSETALVTWWEEYVAPWFSAETWLELGQGILDGIGEKWEEFSSWWGTTINDWFTNNVAIWFTAERWKELGDNMKKGIFNGFKGILNKLEGLLNSMITGFENMCNKIITAINEIISEWNSSAGLIKSFRIDTFAPLNMGRIKFDIPALANGAVLRGGDPFMAILGDQPRGQTNVETPVYVIEDAVSKAMGRYSGSGNVTVNLNYDGETFARLSLKDILGEMDRQGYDVDVLRGIT